VFSRSESLDESFRARLDHAWRILIMPPLGISTAPSISGFANEPLS
jgi:hypothetical protein